MTVSKAELLAAVPELAGPLVLVVGEVCLDDYYIGRIQPTATDGLVPVLELEERRQVAGGVAAIPAANIVALGGKAMLLGLIGEDEAGINLRTALNQAGIDLAGLLSEPTRSTLVKLHWVARSGSQLPRQLARMDQGNHRPLSPELESAVGARLTQLIPQAKAVLFSDHQSGLASRAVVEAARQAAKAGGALLIADSHGDLGKYHQFTLVKCSQAEAERYLVRSLTSQKDFQGAMGDIITRLGVSLVVMTHGAEGLSLGTATGEYFHLPSAIPSEVFDLTGTEEMVMAVITLALATGKSAHLAATLANYAAGIVAHKSGYATITPNELRGAIENWPLSKITEPARKS